MITLFDRASLYCSDRTTLTLESSYLLNMFKNCGYSFSFTRRSMRHKISQDHRQKKNSTPEAPSEDHQGQRTAKCTPFLHQRHLRDTSLTPPKPQHQSGPQTYGHPLNYPGESQRHHLPGCKGKRDLPIPMQRMQFQICWRNWLIPKNQDNITQRGGAQPLHVVPHNPTMFGHRPPIRT